MARPGQAKSRRGKLDREPDLEGEFIMGRYRGGIPVYCVRLPDRTLCIVVKLKTSLSGLTSALLGLLENETPANSQPELIALEGHRDRSLNSGSGYK